MSGNLQPQIAFIDLKAQRRRLGDNLDRAIGRVLDHAGFIMGPEVRDLEAALAAFAGARHCVTCANGTDALVLALMARRIGPGDAVFVPAFTFVATAEAPAIVGATPYFVDVDPVSFNMDPKSLEDGIAGARRAGLEPAAVIPVDLFGLPAAYQQLEEIAHRHGLFLLADGAQSFGATVDGRRVGTFGSATAVSFFPAKPLGCYGDGGALFTDDDGLAATLRSLRVHGQGSGKYDNVRVGLNSRLDTLQAAILLEKLAIFEDEIAARNRIAAVYRAGLSSVAGLQAVPDGVCSVWAQFTILVNGRDLVAERLKAAGIPTAVYYPIPLNRQAGYQNFPSVPNGLPVSEQLSQRVLSLPMSPYLDEASQSRIIDAVHAAVTTRP